MVIFHSYVTVYQRVINSFYFLGLAIPRIHRFGTPKSRRWRRSKKAKGVTEILQETSKKGRASQLVKGFIMTIYHKIYPSYMGYIWVINIYKRLTSWDTPPSKISWFKKAMAFRTHDFQPAATPVDVFWWSHHFSIHKLSGWSQVYPLVN